jgi:hypothetical protein
VTQVIQIEVPFWIYWLVCGLPTLLVLFNTPQVLKLISDKVDSPCQRKGYIPSLIGAWAASLLAAICYVLFTHKQVIGFYRIQDLVIFSLLNGILEQFMFVFWFLLGCWLGHLWGIQSAWKIFGLGFLSYCIYSGGIHALFWVKVLPFHQPALVMPLVLMIMSLGWMWMFWRYRAITAIIFMHMVVDFLTIGHLHFTWFEPYQIF